MTTSRIGLARVVKFLGSDLGGMSAPPDGVDDLMEDWRRSAGIPCLHYRIITREVGAANMKRLTVRGVKNGRFLEVRVNPDCGGNDNCWLASVVIDPADFGGNEKRLREAADVVNARRPERHTPTPAAPVAPPPDPYAALGLVELRNRRQQIVEKRDAREEDKKLELKRKEDDELKEKIHFQNIVSLEAQLKEQCDELARVREHMKEADRRVSENSSIITQCNRELEKINTAIETKVRAEAREIANPLRAMMVEEAAKRGISVEEIMRELAAQPTTT